MKIIGYARLSTREQSRGQTLDQQIDRLKKAGAEEVYYDLESGRKDNREQFQKLIKEAEENKVSKIICTRVDRFSRNMITAISTAQNLFEKHNVKLLFLDDPDLNLKSSDGIFALHLHAALAQRESDQISERVKHGKEYQRNHGLAVATRPPYGYIITKQRKYQLDRKPLLCLLSQRPSDYLLHQEFYNQLYQNQLNLYNFDTDVYYNWDLLINSKVCQGINKADIARDIIESYIELNSASGAITKVYEKYGYPSRTFESVTTKAEQESYILNRFAVTNWLANPTLRGHIPHRKEEYRKNKSKSDFKIQEEWDIVLDTHPTERLMTDEEWELIESLLVINSKRKYIKKNDYNYSGIIFCNCCENKMTTKSGSSGHRYYACRTINCSNKKSIREEQIDDAVLKSIFKKAIELNVSLTKKSSFVKSEILITLEKRLERTLNDLKEDPTDPILIKNKRDYQKQISEELEKEDQTEVWDKSAEELIRHPSLKDIGFLYTLSNEQKRLVYHKLIKSISINNSEVQNIEFKFE